MNKVTNSISQDKQIAWYTNKSSEQSSEIKSRQYKASLLLKVHDCYCRGMKCRGTKCRGTHHTRGVLQILKYNIFHYFQMPHVLLEFLHSKQTEEDEILNVDEMVTEAEKQ